MASEYITNLWCLMHLRTFLHILQHLINEQLNTLNSIVFDSSVGSDDACKLSVTEGSINTSIHYFVKWQQRMSDAFRKT